MGMRGGPRLPSPLLADVGKGRFLRGRRAVALDRLEAGEWRELGRFCSVHDAGVALDELSAGGVSSDQIRTREVGRSMSALAAWGVAAALFVIVVAFATYMLSRILF